MVRCWVLLIAMVAACFHDAPHGGPLGRPPPPGPPSPGPTPAPLDTSAPDPQPLGSATTPVTRVQIDLDDEAQLAAAGFHRVAGGSASTFAGGTLTIESHGFEEWEQMQGFVDSAGDPGGWAVEARFKLDVPCSKPSTGWWIHDGFHWVRFGITDHEAVFTFPPARIDIGPTNVFRTYRIELDGEAMRLVVDGKQVWQGAAMTNQASIVLMFGVLGDSCADNRSTWDYIAYETHPVPAPTWASRETFHRGTPAAALAKALGPLAPTGADAQCLLLGSLDSAVRDLLAASYDATSPGVGERFRRLQPLDDERNIEMALQVLLDATTPRQQPICDPAPGAPCGPPVVPPSEIPSTPVSQAVQAALIAARSAGRHPQFAVQAATLIARAYAEAKLPAADQRLTARLAAHTARCGF